MIAKMMILRVVLCCLVVLIILVMPVSVFAMTIYVPDGYSTIQAAVDAASAGDTILVRSGIYNENIDVNKPLTIMSVNTIIQAKDANDAVFDITADKVKISGFTVTGAYEDAGIDLSDVNYCNISNNICTNNEEGIYIILSNNNSISSNNCSYNNMAGIILGGSSNNSISNNKCLSNINVSIYIVSHSCSNSVSNNTCSDSQRGILLATAANNNSISKNTCSNNEIGIYPAFDSNNNIFYLNNFINNNESAFSLESTNMWNSISLISYTYNGTAYQNYLGNYWDDYTGSDSDGDGIGDRPYNLNTDSDMYPLIGKFVNSRIVPQSGIETKPVFGVEFSANTAALSTSPGENAIYELTVSNTGTVVDSYTLTVKNPDNADVAALSTRDITNLAAGASTTVRLSVTDAMAGSYTASVTATSVGDPTKSDTVSTTTTVEDSTPPASIINLTNTTYAQTYINWTWNDPADADLSHVMVYLNGGFQINVSKGTQFFNATELTPDIAYTIGTCTVDTSGNKNQTMVNHTTRTALDTKPPVIIHTPIITAIERSPIRISATITDDIEVASATLFFRITGEETWASTSMSPIGNNYSATLPASNVTTAGVEYYIEVVDAALNAAHSPATAPKAPYSITIKPVFGVELSVDTAARSTAPGENALYKLTVNNTGAVVDTYTLSVKNPDNADLAALSIYPHITNLAAGASTTVRLYVTDAMDGSYKVSVTATSVGDPTKSDTISTTTTVEDTTPPASISNLKNTTYAQAYINWTWNDPADADLSHVRVYVNGYFQINVSKGTQFYNATKLTPDSAYTIGTRTVDRSGNNNQTMVNHTARTALDTKPPVIIHTQIITAIEGSPIPISAIITDDINVESATLFFRITGKETWTPTSMSPIGNNYSAAIPASNVTNAGVEYYIEAVDAALNAAHSPATSVTVSGRSIVTISATPSTINLSDSVTISGKIIPAHSAIVTLSFTTPSGTVLEQTKPSARSGAYKYDFTPNEGGIWFVNATWTGSSDIAGNISETESFTVNIGPVYYALIIAGGKNDQSQGNFDRTANKAYKKLLTRAFTHKRIFYLNPSMEQDADGDGKYDVDRISSLTNISYAIGTWAQGNVGATDTLLVYMVNHGEINTFIVNGVDNILTATDLNDHLDNFTDATGCKDIVVVYDACFSGSFIDELSRPGRTIITSTNINAMAIFDDIQGGFFSHCFFNSISIGKTIKAAFVDTSNFPDIEMFKQFNMTPLLDDNADRVGHAIPLSGTGDGLLVASKYIGFLYGDPKFPPTITDVIPSQEVVVNTTITIWSIVVDDCSINDVYASIFEPNFNISSTKDTQINLTTLYLEDPDGDGNYTASFTPTELGNYTLILHATDDEGYIASPKQCIITTVLPSENAIFNTCLGTYPSIFGKHNGIWNSTWKGVEARTGSYPQIIHESSNEILGGEIACREFMAANRYLYINVMGFPL